MPHRAVGAKVGSAVGCSVGRDVGAGLGGRVVVSTPMELVSTTTDEPRSAATAVWKSELERSEVVLVASAETSLFSVTKSKADVQTTLDDRRRRRLRFCLLRLNEYVNVQPRMESVLTPSWVATVCLSVAESASVGAAEAAKSRDTLSVTVVPSVGCADTLGSNVGCGYGAPLGSGVGESVGSAVGASEGSAEGAVTVEAQVGDRDPLLPVNMSVVVAPEMMSQQRVWSKAVAPLNMDAKVVTLLVSQAEMSSLNEA